VSADTPDVEVPTAPADGESAYERWELPNLEQGGPLTAHALQSVQKSAYEEAHAEGRKSGFARGLAEGRAAGRTETEPLLAQVQTLLGLLAEPLQQLDDEIEATLAAVAMAVARQLVRREIRLDPGEVVGVVREAVSALPGRSRDVRLYLNPEDMSLLREALALDDDAPWTLVEDPVLSRGGCRVETDASRIDASVEGRLATAIAAVLGDERSADGDDGRPGA
jgi:flagellar assembly protein FliH